MRLPTVLLLLFFSALLGAQRAGDPAAAGDADLRSQFDEMLRVSSNYQQYKTVRKTYLASFMQNVADSLTTKAEKISELQRTIDRQEEQIASLTSSVAERDGNISSLEDKKDSISLLGVPLSKTTYSIILWSAIIGLLAFALLALTRMRVAVASSRELREHNEKVTQELEDSRKQRLTVEQKLRRQLQDEINKNRG